MLKLMGHFLALVAMAASVGSAQCAVSCSLHSNPQSVSSETSHSCCPHQGAPAPAQPADGHRCHPTVAAADQAQLKNSSVTFNLIPLAIVVGRSDAYGPHFAKTQLDPPNSTHSPGLSPPSLISILRV